jgi:hypothetical protein
MFDCQKHLIRKIKKVQRNKILSRIIIFVFAGCCFGKLDNVSQELNSSDFDSLCSSADESYKIPSTSKRIKGLYIGMNINWIPSWFNKYLKDTRLTYKVSGNQIIIAPSAYLNESFAAEQIKIFGPIGDLSKIPVSNWTVANWATFLNSYPVWLRASNIKADQIEFSYVESDPQGRVSEIYLCPEVVAHLFKTTGISRSEFIKIFQESYRISELPYITPDGERINIGNFDIKITKVSSQQQRKSNFD